MKPVAIIAVGILAASAAFGFARTVDVVMPKHDPLPSRASYSERNTAPVEPALILRRPAIAAAPQIEPALTIPAPPPQQPAIQTASTPSAPVPSFSSPASIRRSAPPPAMAEAPLPAIRPDFQNITMSGVYR